MGASYESVVYVLNAFGVFERDLLLRVVFWRTNAWIWGLRLIVVRLETGIYSCC